MPLVVKPEQVIKGLENNGFKFVKQKGSHRKYKSDGKTVIVPMHYELAKGTLSSIVEQSGIPLEKILERK
jgi:predicted RNA binding protein YcfA (HicA-like mRNA interferase family)